MTKVNQYPLPEKSVELMQAERAGQLELLAYCRAGVPRSGVQAVLSKETALIPAIISRLANGVTLIQLDHAIKLEVATQGELQAEILCPSQAAVILKFKQLAKTAA